VSTFSEKEFSEKIVADLTVLRADVMTLKALTPDQRRDVLKRVMNILVDVPVLPEYVESLGIAFGIGVIENMITNALSGEAEVKIKDA